MALDIPVLETARLRLRGHRLADFEDCVTLWSDPEVTRFVGGKPSTREEVWMRLAKNNGLWSLLGHGPWAVEEKDSGAYLGGVGFYDGKRDIVPSLEGLAEVGWALTPRVHGKGYATEAVRAVLAWGDAHLNLPMVCIIDPENLASIRVAEKVGFRVSQQTTYRDHPIIIFRRELRA